MTTDITIRYAKDINIKNEIADFKFLNIHGANISAVSWEKKNTIRSVGISSIISSMIEKIPNVTNPPYIYIYSIVRLTT
ncbi:hypothetical protein [Pasteurella testudinis]|uniref:hypothetical protein n=1 Tax=Pasteurella testudinis TaxID=761 RepID=UPI004059B9D0